MTCGKGRRCHGEIFCKSWRAEIPLQLARRYETRDHFLRSYLCKVRFSSQVTFTWIYYGQKNQTKPVHLISYLHFSQVIDYDLSFSQWIPPRIQKLFKLQLHVIGKISFKDIKFENNIYLTITLQAIIYTNQAMEWYGTF